jgi:hypothetical protein
MFCSDDKSFNAIFFSPTNFEIQSDLESRICQPFTTLAIANSCMEIESVVQAYYAPI